ncbi:MAG: bactofilin family protein [Myxococcota bacterium]
MAIFSEKKDEKPTAPLRREELTVSAKAGGVPTLLGKGSEFEGKLTFEGEVRIDGKFTGQISTKDTLIIGEGAKVSAEIHAGTIIVHGSVEGNLHATQTIELNTPGRVKGSIETPSLKMDRGVVFEGTCKMESLGAKSSGIPAPAPMAAAAAK